MATYWENSCSFGLRYVSWYKCLIVSLVFSHLGFWSGNLFLIAPFPDLCLLVPLPKAEPINSEGKMIQVTGPADHGIRLVQLESAYQAKRPETRDGSEKSCAVCEEYQSTVSCGQ